MSVLRECLVSLLIAERFFKIFMCDMALDIFIDEVDQHCKYIKIFLQYK